MNEQHTQMLFSEYRRLRCLGLPARSAYHYSRPRPSRPWPPLEEGQPVRWEADSFHWRAWTEPDPLPELADTLGRFTDTWAPGAIAHANGRRSTRSFRWFMPAITEVEHYAALRDDVKLGRTDARERARRYVHEAYQRACRHGDDWSCLIVRVSASLEGLELDHSCLCGIESDSDPAFFDEVIENLVPDVLSGARRRLERLLAHIHAA